MRDWLFPVCSPALAAQLRRVEDLGAVPCLSDTAWDRDWEVWLEAVGSSFVESISVVPDLDRGRVHIEAEVNGADRDLTLTAEAFANGRSVGKDATPAAWRNHRLVLDLTEKHLWEPGSPFLYDLKFTLTQGGIPSQGRGP